MHNCSPLVIIHNMPSSDQYGKNDSDCERKVEKTLLISNVESEAEARESTDDAI